ncbi:hypothetical protein ACF0H5_002516 [Mactra antiquata]
MYSFVIVCALLPCLFCVARGCCLPTQYSANLVETTGEYNRDLDVASLAYSTRDYFYDYTGKQIAYREKKDNATAHTKIDSWVIFKYSTGKKYTIISNNCTTDDLTDDMESPCIPDDATPFGDHSYPAGIKASIWYIPDHVQGGNKRLSVTKDGCMPLSLSIITGGSDYILRSSLYQNVTTKITDPSVFTVPDICKHDSNLSDTLYYDRLEEN